MSDSLVTAAPPASEKSSDDIESAFSPKAETPEELAATLRPFASNKRRYKEGLAEAMARLASKWAPTHPWIRSVYLLDSTPDDPHSKIGLLVSADDLDTQKHWACGDFAALMGGYAEAAVEICVIHEEIEPLPGYIFAYSRLNA